MALDVASVVAILVTLLAAGALLAWRYAPRLRVELSLRGSTRAGTLYVTLTNRGASTARGVRVDARWRGEAGDAPIDGIDVGDITGRDALTVQVRDLQRDLDPTKRWDALVVRVRGRNTWPRAREATLDLAKRAATARDERAPPVQYRRERACVTPDGQHWFQEHTLPNDCVVEHWRVCRRCGLATRAPLSAADEATQRRVRAERAAGAQRELEAELSRASDGPSRRAPRPPPARREEGELPVEVARWILGIEEEAPTLAQIDDAYKRLAKEYHPDKLPPDASPAARRVMEERMRDLNVAREALRRASGGTSASR